MCGILFTYLLGGVVVVEQLFSFTGVGDYAIKAVSLADYTVLQGFLLVIAFLSLSVFLVTDLVNMSIDPRRRLGRAGDAL